MRFDTSMQVRLEQRMKLAPRMIQSMEILQLPLLALEERIQQELVTNPVLEIEEDEEGPAETGGEAEAAPAPESASTLAPEEQPLKVDERGGAEEFDRLQDLADECDNYFEESVPRPRARLDDEHDPKLDAMRNAPAPAENLHDVLLQQLSYLTSDARLRELGEAIIRNLDDNGYLRESLDEIRAEAQGGAAAEEAEAALKLVQRMEPAGVAARDLKECLLLQLDRLGDADGLVRRIISDHLHDIENNRYPQVARKLGVAIDEIKDAVDVIRSLNPKPGASISSERAPYIVSDVQIVYDEKHDNYLVVVNDDRAPRLQISAQYRHMLQNRGLDAKTREFVARNVRSARWLMEAIEQRRMTLLRVVQSIVKFQRPFLDHGPEHIQPLKMQQVADDVKLHVGTVSRAVDDKYADTPWGLFALRGFFTGGTETAAGESVAWDNIRTRLKQMVDAEDKAKPLSDEEIVDRFKAEGVELARRTVAKYRKVLDIPSSRKRKQF